MKIKTCFRFKLLDQEHMTKQSLST